MVDSDYDLDENETNPIANIDSPVDIEQTVALKIIANDKNKNIGDKIAPDEKQNNYIADLVNRRSPSIESIADSTEKSRKFVSLSKYGTLLTFHSAQICTEFNLQYMYRLF